MNQLNQTTQICDLNIYSNVRAQREPNTNQYFKLNIHTNYRIFISISGNVFYLIAVQKSLPVIVPC